MATLADNKRDFLLGQGIANGDLARMEKTYYQGLSGLANPESYSLVDHKRAFFKTFLGLSDAVAGVLSISALEALYLNSKLMFEPNVVPDPSFEGSISWSGLTNCTVSHSTDYSSKGPQSLKVTSTATANMSCISVIDTFSSTIKAKAYSVQPDEVWVASAWVRTQLASRSAWVALAWYKADGSWISSDGASAQAVPVGTFTKFTHTSVAPALASYMIIVVSLATPASIGEVFYVEESAAYRVPIPSNPYSLNQEWNKFYSLVNAIKSPGNPYAWFDARFPSGFNVALPADNAALSQWNDLSGNGYHAVQGTGGQQPQFKRTAGLGVGKCIQFDGVDDQLVFNSPAINTPFTVYAVFQVLSAGVTESIYGGNPADNNGTSIFTTSGPAPYIRLWAGPAGSAGESQTLTQTTPVVFTGAWGTTSAIAYVNGIQGTTIVETVGVAGTISYIGSENTAWGNANIYALVIYNQAHNDATRQSIERALGAVFGIAVA